MISEGRYAACEGDAAVGGIVRGGMPMAAQVPQLYMLRSWAAKFLVAMDVMLMGAHVRQLDLSVLPTRMPRRLAA